MPIQTQHKKGVIKENHVCSYLCDLWSSRIFSSISLLWLGAKVCWLMKSRGRGWSGSWSPNSACEAFTQYLVNKIQPRTQHEKNKKHQYTKYINDWMHTVEISNLKLYLQRVWAQQSMSDKWTRQTSGCYIVAKLQTQEVPVGKQGPFQWNNNDSGIHEKAPNTNTLFLLLHSLLVQMICLH